MSTPSAVPETSPVRRRRVATREEAIAACVALLDEGGAEALSMRNLAARLHVSLPTVYTLVDSREHLIEEVLARQLVALLDKAGDEIVGWPGTQGWVAERPWVVALLRQVPIGPHARLSGRVAADRPVLAKLAPGGDAVRLLQSFLFSLEGTWRALDAGLVPAASVDELLGTVSRSVLAAGS